MEDKYDERFRWVGTGLPDSNDDDEDRASGALQYGGAGNLKRDAGDLADLESVGVCWSASPSSIVKLIWLTSVDESESELRGLGSRRAVGVGVSGPSTKTTCRSWGDCGGTMIGAGGAVVRLWGRVCR